MVFGVDFGAQKAGTTVISGIESGRLVFRRSKKQRSADKFLIGFFSKRDPALIMLDAPLSLPGVLRELPEYSDYFYRVADRELSAMSPMFLGGLTARAMKLAAKFTKIGHTVVECYPAKTGRILLGKSCQLVALIRILYRSRAGSLL